MEGVIALLIALVVVCIPLIVMTGRHVVQPLVQVLSRLTLPPERPAAPEHAELEIAELSARVERMESLLTRVAEEQQFQRALQDGSPPGGPLPAPADTDLSS